MGDNYFLAEYTTRRLKDQKVIEQLRKGNTAVFKELYNHYPMIRNMVIKNSGTDEDAKDLFQNALIVFYKKAISPDFVLTAKISSYLYAVCDNNWKKKLTRDKSRHHGNLDNINESSHSTEMEIDVDHHPKPSIKETVDQLLEEIGEPCKSILIMHEYKKLSMKEITKALGYANDHTTRQQKYKCIQKLKKLIPNEVKQAFIGA